MDATQHQVVPLPINHPLRVAARTLDEIARFLQLCYDFERFKCEYNAEAVWNAEFPDCDENVGWRHLDRLEAIDDVSATLNSMYEICDAGTMQGWHVRSLEQSLVKLAALFYFYYPTIAEDLADFDEEISITSHAKSSSQIRADADTETDRLDAFIEAGWGLMVDEFWAPDDQREKRRNRRLHEFPLDGIAPDQCEPFLLTLEAICGFLDVFQNAERWRIEFNSGRSRLDQFPPRWATAAFHHEFMKCLELTIRALETLYLAVCPAMTVSTNDLRGNYAGLVSAYTAYFKQLSSDMAAFPHVPCLKDTSLSAASEMMRTLLATWTNERWTPEPGMNVAQSWEKRKYGYRRRSFPGDGSASRTTY